MHQQALHTSLLERNDHSGGDGLHREMNCVHQERRRELPNPNHGEIGESSRSDGATMSAWSGL
jgi:hypothetical protein